MKERNRDERASNAARSRVRKSEHSEIRLGRPKSSNESKVSYQKRIYVPGAPDFGPSIEELLEVAGITSTADARARLDTNLTIAWGEYRHDNRTRAPKNFSHS
jgi:hypothetical protein